MADNPRTPLLAGALGFVLLLLAACAGEGPEPAGQDASPAGCSAPDEEGKSTCDGSPEGHAAAAEAVLEPHGLDGLGTVELVDELEALPLEERPEDLTASVRYDEVVISGADGQEHPVPIEDDLFYLSFAPYADETHDCFFHSLTTCLGELREEEIDVLVTGPEGEVLVEETTRTHPNGFLGLWLPRDIEGELSVSHSEGEATLDISTHDDAPTCLTTLRLEPRVR